MAAASGDDIKCNQDEASDVINADMNKITSVSFDRHLASGLSCPNDNISENLEGMATGISAEFDGTSAQCDKYLYSALTVSSERRASFVTCDSRNELSLPSTSSGPVKIAVFGADGVGKTALIVRLITGRFIGEYDPSLEAIYSYSFPEFAMPVQIMDTAGKVSEVVAVKIYIENRTKLIISPGHMKNIAPISNFSFNI